MATHNYTPAQQSVITEALNLVQERAATESYFMTSPSETFEIVCYVDRKIDAQGYYIGEEYYPFKDQCVERDSG
jgi:hypothetical protein